MELGTNTAALKQGKELHHNTFQSETPTVKLDYDIATGAKRPLQPDEKPNDTDSHYKTILCVAHTLTGLRLEVVVTRKGHCNTAETKLVKLLLQTR